MVLLFHVNAFSPNCVKSLSFVNSLSYTVKWNSVFVVCMLFLYCGRIKATSEQFELLDGYRRDGKRHATFQMGTNMG